ncbi:MAG: transporter substrate-binding domain-containing protein [Chloroflexota bacterium]|nr:transporter substrate-binding domain-containing protein [Chloroflexota bacterium]
MKVMEKLEKGRALLALSIIVPGMLLAGCGTIAATPTVNTPATPTVAMAAATDTTVMAAPTNTAGTAMMTPSVGDMTTPTTSGGMMGTPTDAGMMGTPTGSAMMTPGAMMSPTGGAMMTPGAMMSPTVGSMMTPGVMGTGTPAASGGVTAPNATPVSTWKSGAHAKSVPAPSKLVSAGTLTVGSDASYPPQEYIDSSGKAVGLDIDIAEEIASRLGLTLKVTNFKFDDIIPALNASQFDIIVSAMTITDERKKVVSFVPYLDAGQAVLVAKGNPKGIKTLDDLSGKTAATEQGTVEEQTLKDLNAKLGAAKKPLVTVLVYQTDTDAVDQLRIGRADATLHDSPVAAYYATLNPDKFEAAIPDFASASEGIAVKTDNTDMLASINKAMAAMKADGSLDAIKGKWGVK